MSPKFKRLLQLVTFVLRAIVNWMDRKKKKENDNDNDNDNQNEN